MTESLPAVSAMTDGELATEREELVNTLLTLGERYRNAMQINSESEKEAHSAWAAIQEVNGRLQEIALEREVRDA